MGLYYVKDNRCLKPEVAQLPLVKNLENRTLKSLYADGFIVFPPQPKASKDLYGHTDQCVFSSLNGKVKASNVAGTLGDGHDEVRIISRFTADSNHRNDYFLRYMMQTVLNFNIVSQRVKSSANSNYYDLLPFMFPYFLHEAMMKGVYKEYVRHQYNDANVKGTIDIARHIRTNEPFVGRVAYHTREFSYDNGITELIRHTIEKIQSEDAAVLSVSEECKAEIRTIKQTTHRYNRLNRQKVIHSNILNPVNQGYFEDYATLQRLCIQILTDEKSGYGNSDLRVGGIIIDVAWLWENYIDKITPWTHYGYAQGLPGINFFKNKDSGNSRRYPDFVYKGMPIDTKYKISLTHRDDYNQLTTYLYLLKANKGGFLQPVSEAKDAGYHQLGIINGLGGELFTYQFLVPPITADEDYDDFVGKIRQSEQQLVDWFEE